ncbi:MAG TPA: hypothetical protein VLD19_02150 [Chitinophagaceae bacterium]|nr:hypothetical protein [Chitinophagaceae bacterium]
MKNVVFVFLLAAWYAQAPAQGVFTNQTNGALERVIQDYPNQFKNIKGDLLTSNPREAEYKSVVTIPGSESSVVTQYTGADKHIVSWQAILYSSTDFDKAENKFKSLYGEIKNTIVRLEGERPVILNGKYETPEEGRNTTTVAFDILPSTGPTRQLKVDLALQKNNRRWVVVLSVYDKDRKEEQVVANNAN